MDEHLRQAIHNGGLLTHLEDTFPNTYNDWKVTLIYYIALHQVRAFAKLTSVSIGRSHRDLEIAMKNQGASVPNLDVDGDCTSAYLVLESVSRAARYDGIRDPAMFEFTNSKRLAFSKTKLQKIKDHLRTKGLPV